MDTIILKQELHKFIDEGDDKILKMVYAPVREYVNDDLTQIEIDQLEERTLRRKSGESKLYNLDEAKKIITGKTAS
jgi:hypothetical protein